MKHSLPTHGILLSLLLLLSCNHREGRPRRAASETGVEMLSASMRFADRTAESVWSAHNAITFAENMPYAGYDPDHQERLTFDFYRPGGVNKKLPLVLFIHPGAFLVGDKKEFVILHYCLDFCRAGFATASLNYRSIGHFNSRDWDRLKVFFDKGYARSLIMEAVGDVRTAIHYFKQEHEYFNIDPDRIYLVGFSAGGIIANHVLFTDPYEASEYASPKGLGRLFWDDEIDNLGMFDTPGKDLVRGVAAISGGLMEYDHFDDQDLSPDARLLLIHGQNDGVVNMGNIRPFMKYAKQIEIDLPVLFHELGIRKEIIVKGDVIQIEQTTIGGILSKIIIPKWVPKKLIDAFTSPVCGSKSLYELMRSSNRECQYIEIEGGGHSFMIDSTGLLTPFYQMSRDRIYHFISSQEGVSTHGFDRSEPGKNRRSDRRRNRNDQGE